MLQFCRRFKWRLNLSFEAISFESLLTKVFFLMQQILHNYPFLKWIGAIVVCFKLFKLSTFLLKLAYPYLRKNFEFTWKELAKWAVITGGTDGIGKAYAEELAERGFNICLISRNIEKLNEVATEILNNVGMSYKYSEYFHAIPDGLKVMMDLINSNIASCTMMTKLILPQMEERGKGLIINISSLIAVYPTPLLTTYAACKAYVDYFSRALQHEYKDKGISIQCVLPGYVATKMSNRRKRLEVPSAKAFVSSAIKTVGLEDYTYGYLPHKLRGFFHEWLKANMPTFVNMAIALHYMTKSRKNYFRRLQKKDKK
ncbi:very-long-chain 3-oxoacyl-CoA reductase-like isoform X2 [Stegodyphus dumicola]|uniref:very-long-chain 3-oxoacyl-CoA reductase-like isoform X2 n=1 Tax=Stegodyphus dumicola TaxID=202533 RepID=UPI0015AE18F2|nr:very-long-chain 3-oxoacyl-CoA reductase-like isoform X2 [Stegodyphus dumicola]